MIRTLRRALILLVASIGITAVTAAPAYAGLVLNNHSEPLTHAMPTYRGAQS